MAFYKYASLIVLLFSVTVSLTWADGAIYLQFLSYENKEGTASNGHCCDGKWNICQAWGCDHMFKICLDKHNGFGCTYGRAYSSSIANQNEIEFGNTIGNLSNPMVFPYKGPVPNQLDVKVMVYDDDGYANSNDFVEMLKFFVKQMPHSPEYHIASGRTKLRFEIWFRCLSGQCENEVDKGKRAEQFSDDMDLLRELDYEGF